MTRAALFVDAGYLFSAGSHTVFGERRSRRQLELIEAPRLIKLLADRAVTCCGEDIRILRTYWYDGAVDGVPSQEQVAIGELPQVKLRLGRVSGGGQKGVDGLIILDLLNLARNRAIDIAILLSGDEDLREAALFAQGFGLTLVVAGFERTPHQAQSVLLLREADHVVELTRDDVAGHLVPRLAVAAPAGHATSGEPAPAATVVETAPVDVEDADESLREVCRGVISDPRFAGGGLLDPNGHRLSRRADKVLVARIAELTGTFPIDPTVLAKVRNLCLELLQVS